MTGRRSHVTACVLSVGDELVLGQALDTNSRWISERLMTLGVRPVQHATVPDDLEGQAEAMTRMARTGDVVIATGGLGPTMDDLTRHALARAMGDEVVEDAEALAFLHDLENKRGRTLTPERRAQALRPSRGTTIPNAFGTAPGLRAVIDGADVFCLPGPPREMRPMFEQHVVPALRPAERVLTRVLRTYGLPEADAGARLADLMERGANPTVGTTASGGIVSVRLRATGNDAERLLDDAERAVRERLGWCVFGGEEETLESLAVRLLRERGERVVCAESCTGGLLAGAITSVSGSSDVFDGGLITYRDEVKVRELGIDPAMIQEHGVVSTRVARAMAEGVLNTTPGERAQHGIGITGIAGPTGERPGKPVGTVCIGYAQRGAPTEVRRFLIAGDRDDVRARSVTAALGMLTMRLRGVEPEGELLWEVDDAPS